MIEINVPEPLHVATLLLNEVRNGCSSAQCKIAPKNTPTREYCRCIYTIEQVLLGVGGPYRAFENIEREIRDLEHDLDRAEDREQEEMDARIDAENELEDLAKDKEALQEDFDEAQEEIARLNRELDDARALIEAGEADVVELQDQIESLRMEMREIMEMGEL